MHTDLWGTMTIVRRTLVPIQVLLTRISARWISGQTPLRVPPLRQFQLTLSHIEETLELVALAYITAVFIVAGFTVVQPYAVEWR
jgi:hypothetical protein